jgi:signal transduction histidine kinase
MATGLPAETETEGVRDDGSRFPVRISAFPIFGPNGQVVGFIEVVEDITQRRRAEEALRASQEALRKSKESYQSLAGQLLTAQEAERSRLARELHDDLSQRLAALAMEAARLEDQPQSSQGAVSTGLKVMKDKLVEMSIDINAISRRLHPSVLDDLGLADAVHSECASFAQRERIVVNYKSESVPREVPPDVALCIYRIVQEGLRNISRHARATEAEILLIGKGDTIHLLIKDNGIGVNPFQVEKGGLGLASMKERVHLMRGDFSIKSQPGQGTVIEALVPLSRSTLDETDANIAGR